MIRIKVSDNEAIIRLEGYKQDVLEELAVALKSIYERAYTNIPFIEFMDRLEEQTTKIQINEGEKNEIQDTHPSTGSVRKLS